MFLFCRLDIVSPLSVIFQQFLPPGVILSHWRKCSIKINENIVISNPKVNHDFVLYSVHLHLVYYSL